MSIKFIDTDFQKKSQLFIDRTIKATTKAIDQVANEILRLSSFEVPHDKGMLQSSGAVENGASETEKVVGYNRVYAARLHENPQYNFQKGRKGKYLEDPIKNNYRVFLGFIQDAVKGAATK